MRPLRRALRLAAISIALFATLSPLRAPPCSAQTQAAGKPARPPPRVRDLLEGDARASFDRGGELFRDGDFAGARIAYDRAQTLSGELRVAYNIAACDKALRKYARALSVLQASLDKGKGQLPAEHVALVRDTMGVLAPFVSTIVIESSEDGASVLLDGEPAGTTPLAAALTVDLGEHTITLEKPGFDGASTRAQVASDMPAKVRLELSQTKPKAAPPVNARVRIQVDEATSRIYLDSELVGSGAWAGSIAPGHHVVRVERKDRKPYSTMVDLREGEVRKLDVTLPIEIPTWAWVTGGALLTGAGVALGVALAPTNYTGNAPGTLPPRVVPVGFPIGGLKW